MSLNKDKIGTNILERGLCMWYMNEKVIRYDILKFYYELYKKKGPAEFERIAQFADKYALTKQELDGHVRYLYDKQLLFCMCSSATHDYGTPFQCKITVDGIDAIENPEKFAPELPFLNLINIFGDVTNSPIFQAENIRIENGFNHVNQAIEDSDLDAESKRELLKDVKELELEGNKKKPDIEKMKSLLDKARKIWAPVYDLLKPLIQECIKRYFGSGS